MATITVVQHAAGSAPLDYIDPLIYGDRQDVTETGATFVYGDEKIVLTVTGTEDGDQIVKVDEYDTSGSSDVLFRTISGVHVNIDAVLEAIDNGDDYQVFADDDAFNIDGSSIAASSNGLGLYYSNPIGDGDDTVTGSDFTDLVALGGGKDVAHGGGNWDEFDGGSGNDSLYGDGGNDLLAGGTGDDLINGGPGSDWYAASGFFSAPTGVTIDLAKSVVVTAYGHDTLISIENAYGTYGKDHLYGTKDANRLFGFNGADTLKGLAGNDRLGGGVGIDKLYGGSGRDQFVFAEWGTRNADHITDYKVKDDTIRLDKYYFTKLASGTLKAGNFVVGTHAKDANDYVIYDRAHGKLYYDSDGNHKAHSAQLIATIDNHAHLTHSDIAVTNLETTNWWLL